jgi:hypothetical protein
MNNADLGQWQPMDIAPKDGTRVLVEVRASEQGPAEVDSAHWAKDDRSGEGLWVAADSDPECVITYAEAELLGWMPLPTPLPKLRSDGSSAGRPRPVKDPASDEIGGSGI